MRTQEHIGKIVEARKKNPSFVTHLQNMNAARKGTTLSLEHRARISAGLRGRIQSEETKAKIGEKHRGKIVSQETRDKQSLARRGKPHPKGADSHAWKGGLTSVNRTIRQSQESFAWRKAVFERDDYTCVSCDIRGGYLEADHIKPFATHPELRFVVDNGQTLCKPCHAIKTSEDMELMRRETSIWKPVDGRPPQEIT